MIFVDHVILAEVMHGILEELKVSRESIHHLISSLIQTSLRGVDSHGINLFPYYCHAIEAKRINKNPKMIFTPRGETVGVIDADHGFGHHAAAIAMDQAVIFAKSMGIGAVSIKNSTHFGAAAYFGLRAANQDCIGFVFTNADALVKVFGSNEAFLGTNPICFTAPLEKEEPFCLDMATSIVSWNKIKNFQRENKTIPINWAFDEHGKSVNDSNKARTLSPIGEYKGYGLGLMIDILCGILAGSPIGKDILPMFRYPLDATKRYISHFVMAIYIGKFIETYRFKERLQENVDRLRNLKALQQDEKVMVAGDPEKKHYSKRINEGIPLDDIKYKEFLSLSVDFSKAVKK